MNMMDSKFLHKVLDLSFMDSTHNICVMSYLLVASFTFDTWKSCLRQFKHKLYKRDVFHIFQNVSQRVHWNFFFNEWFLRNLKGFFYMSHPYYCYVFLTGCSILLMKSMDNKCGKLSGWLLDYKFNLHSKQL